MNNQNQKGISSVIIILIVAGVLVIVGGLWVWQIQQWSSMQHQLRNKTTEVQPMSASAPFTQSDLNRIFELSKKKSGTKIYYSDKLGVGFSYLSYIPDSPVKITESGSKIDVNGQTIEVFTKNPKISLEQAIKDRFLQGYNPSDCFVKIYETSEQKLSNYVSAKILFSPPNDPDAPWWQNSDKCPQHYSETNAVQYFLMNKDTPGKFLFVRIGQDSIASDGTSLTAEGGFNWSHSIRILK